jgi:hypothetical protein
MNHGSVFGAIVIHANATSAATQAYEQGLTNYSSLGAMSFYYEEARNFYTENQYVAFHTTQLMADAGSQAGAQFAARQLTAATASTPPNYTALTTSISPPTGVEGYSSSLLTQPFSYSQFNIHPFDQLIGTAATTVGQVYLIIFTFYVGLGFKQALEPFAHKMTLGSEVLVRLVIPFIGYFYISLMYSLVSLAFLVNMNRTYGKGGFPLYWCMNFVSMTGLGYIMELVLLALGPMIFPFFLLFWVVINVSVAFLDVADQDHFYSVSVEGLKVGGEEETTGQPDALMFPLSFSLSLSFFKYGFVLPVYNSVDAAKSIFYGTKNRMGKDFGEYTIHCARKCVEADLLPIPVLFSLSQSSNQLSVARRGCSRHCSGRCLQTDEGRKESRTGGERKKGVKGGGGSPLHAAAPPECNLTIQAI